MLRGEFVEDHRSLMNARVMRDGHCVFKAMALNDVVVNRGATSGMVELRVEVEMCIRDSALTVYSVNHHFKKELT